MDKNLFKELEEIGFKNIDELDIFNSRKTIESEVAIKQIDINTLLYDRTVVCPVCGKEFKTPAVKSSSYKSKGRHSDFYIDYEIINPYFYDVWLCNQCGYASLKAEFDKIAHNERSIILKKISSQWTGRAYPRVLSVNHAIERYKLALLNYIARDSKNSTKAITCLKIAWMYRLVETDTARDLEQSFLNEALKGLKEAYYNESFPIYGMDKHAVMYLIGEIYNRIDDFDEALVWLSNVITIPNVKSSLKELARDQKDLILIKKKQIELKNSEELHDESMTALSPEPEPEQKQKKRGFLSKLFK